MTRNEIIVGLDDSPSGRAALSWAVRQAVLADSLLRAIHVLDWPYGAAADSGVNASQPSHDEIDEKQRTRNWSDQSATIA
jgi:nucleotide-binding universal stress UspA family protein